MNSCRSASLQPLANVDFLHPSTAALPARATALGPGKYFLAPLSAIIWKESRVDLGLVEHLSKNSSPCHASPALEQALP